MRRTSPTTLARVRRAALLGATAAALAVTCASAAEPEVLARVGGTEVTSAEVRAHLETLGASERAALARDPALLAQAVRSYLVGRLVVQAAQAKGWDRQAAVQAQLARARDEALAELYLQSVSQPPEDYPSEAELQRAYQARSASFDTPAQFRLAQLFIAVARAGDPQEEERARARLEEAERLLRAKGADFAAIARERSDERGAASSGGELGWLTEAQLVPGVRATVLGMAPGAISQPVRLADGWHLLQLLETRPASRRTLAEVKEPLAAQLRAERAQANRRLYLARLLEQSPPVVNELTLSTLLQDGR